MYGYVDSLHSSQKSGGMKIIPFDVVCLDINLHPDIKQKMSLHGAALHLYSNSEIIGNMNILENSAMLKSCIKCGDMYGRGDG